MTECDGHHPRMYHMARVLGGFNKMKKPRKKLWHENWVVNRAYDWGTGKNGQPMRYHSVGSSAEDADGQNSDTPTQDRTGAGSAKQQ